MISQKEQILRHLKRGWWITPAQAVDMYQCYTLSQRIGDLINDGHDILRTRMKTERGYCGRYKLIKVAE